MKFSLEMLNLYLELIKFTVEKVHSPIKVFPNVKSFPVMEISINLKFCIN